MAFSLDYNTLNDIPKPDLPYVVDYEFSVVEHLPPEPLEIKSFFLTSDEAHERKYRCLNMLSYPKSYTWPTGLSMLTPQDTQGYASR